MISLRVPLSILGHMLCILGVLMFIPLLIDLSNNEPTWICFLNGLVSTIFVGGFLISATTVKNRPLIHSKELILTVILFWIIAPFFGSLPYLYSSLPFNLFDYYFEAVSSMSTTGSTIIYDFNGVSHGVIVWRAILELIGAYVFIISYCFIFQSIYVGYKNQPTIHKGVDEQQIKEKSILLIGGILILVFFGALAISVASDTNFFVSFFISSSLISTTGLPYTQLPISQTTSMLYICVVLMFISGMPLLTIFDRKWRQIVNGLQFKVYVGMTLSFFIILLIFHGFDYWSNDCIGEALFETVSAITTNSVHFDKEYNMNVISFFLKFIGGCTGCASGGVKILRIIIMAYILKSALAKMANNGTAYVEPKNSFIANQETIFATLSYLIMFILSVAIFGISLAYTGIPFSNALNFAYTAITNNVISSWNSPLTIVDSMTMSNSAKSLLCLAMIIGRLDILTAFVIFSKKFWRR